MSHGAVCPSEPAVLIFHLLGAGTGLQRQGVDFHLFPLQSDFSFEPRHCESVWVPLLPHQLQHLTGAAAVAVKIALLLFVPECLLKHWDEQVRKWRQRLWGWK